MRCSNRSTHSNGSTPPISFPRTACVVKQKTLSVMLSETKHLVLSATYEDEILRLGLRMTVATQSRGEGGLKPGGIERLELFERVERRPGFGRFERLLVFVLSQ